MEQKNKYFSVEPIFKKVSKEEFEQFVSDYPRPLDYNCCGISEPPFITYNDVELADRWPYSIVAKTRMEDDRYGPADRYICVNIKELFGSKL